MAETETPSPLREEMSRKGLPDPHEAHAPRTVHPGAKEYVRIGLILAVLTAIEVYISYSSLPLGLLIGLLVFASVIKFSLVVLWFMHLKFDDRRYARFFVMGFVGAFTLYTIVLVTFQAFAR